MSLCVDSMSGLLSELERIGAQSFRKCSHQFEAKISKLHTACPCMDTGHGMSTHGHGSRGLDTACMDMCMDVCADVRMDVCMDVCIDVLKIL